jgi:hypothetical protein
MAYELHSYVDNNIEFEYSINSTNENSVILELYRGKIFCYIIKEFINKATSLFGTKIFSVKKSFPRTLTNLLSSWMFTLYASENFDSSIDPFLPNNYTETQSLLNTLNDLVKYDETLKEPTNLITILINFLMKLYEEQHKLLSNYKKSNYYLDNKYKYKVFKTKIKQQRDNEYYDFYKYIVNLEFEIKDKRLLNILDNLLLPIDEYEKLKSNYTGKKNMDDIIWSILFRYQLLGSNNHQLGVKSNIMKQMNQNYNLNFECFASAINCTFNHYCSVYQDIEQHFGSVGSFYNLIPKKGTFGMNPPYQKDIIESALNKAISFLIEAKENNCDLTFIITIPIWDLEGKKNFTNDLPQQNIDYGDFEIIKKVRDCEFHRITRMIAKENFTYIDHNFKLAKNKTIQNTYVIILSTNEKIDTGYLMAYDFN